MGTLRLERRVTGELGFEFSPSPFHGVAGAPCGASLCCAQRQRSLDPRLDRWLCACHRPCRMSGGDAPPCCRRGRSLSATGCGSRCCRAHCGTPSWEAVGNARLSFPCLVHPRPSRRSAPFKSKPGAGSRLGCHCPSTASGFRARLCGPVIETSACAGVGIVGADDRRHHSRLFDGPCALDRCFRERHGSAGGAGRWRVAARGLSPSRSS